ncbi:hypothetical protein IMSHALPRED_004276 [Imshaugia aleurites]|uniref:Uncharacterized protein n=1 Tax=Imshaugia aleurites TaxID=172621 RepID=A0A8H3F5F1_9LECA|nr:hypothetical protein IMSHALPRED_004276 [Imshaugia aleurites]
MRILLRLKTLGLALWSTSALAMTIPQGTTLSNPTNTLQTNSSLNTTSNSAFTCVKGGTQARAEPRFADCAGALRSLPLNPVIGTFYNSGHGDFQLPYFEPYKTCTVLVELRSTFDKVQSSWLAVQLAALELNAACEDVRMAPGLRIAYTYLDALGAMKITLKGPGGQLGDGDASDAS